MELKTHKVIFAVLAINISAVLQWVEINLPNTFATLLILAVLSQKGFPELEWFVNVFLLCCNNQNIYVLLIIPPILNENVIHFFPHCVLECFGICEDPDIKKIKQLHN